MPRLTRERRMKLTISKWWLVLIVLIPVTIWAAVTTANDRKSVSGDYVSPNATGVSTQFERMAAAGDFLVGGEPAAGGGGSGGRKLLLGVGS